MYLYLLYHQNELGIRPNGCSRYHVICYGQWFFHAQIDPVSRVDRGDEETRVSAVQFSHCPVTYPFGVAVIPSAFRGT